MSTEDTKTAAQPKLGHSSLKRLVIFLWRELAFPMPWCLLMGGMVIFEAINGATIMGSFWIAVCLMAYFLSRIATAVEKIGGHK